MYNKIKINICDEKSIHINIIIFTTYSVLYLYKLLMSQIYIYFKF